jgi:ParB family chromosome partitioning protein
MKNAQRKDPNIHSLPIDSIHVLNPRSRDRAQHRTIVESIRLTGLRRPVTVSRHPGDDGTDRFNLVCGQGRIEAMRALGHTHVPAILVEADEEDCLVMSLLENIARRSPAPIDVMREIGRLRERGHTDIEIGEFIGVSASWVCMVGLLLDKGEERLLVGVQTGVMSLAMAVDIAKATTPEIQNILSDAYEKGFRGKRLVRLRRILEVRAQSSGQLKYRYRVAPTGQRRNISSAELRRLLEKEADRQRLIAKKAEFVFDRIAYCVAAIKELLAVPEFCALINSEKVDSMPRMLAERMGKLS